MRHPYLPFTALLCFHLAASASAAPTHCSAQEANVFSCSTGKKIISVCASKDLSRSSGYLQYRFGPKNAPEIEVPEAWEHPESSVKSGNLMFSGGGGAWLRFIKGEFAYVVYTATGKGWGAKEGVAVEKGDKRVANIKCKQPSQSIIGKKLFEKAGLSADAKEFNLP